MLSKSKFLLSVGRAGIPTINHSKQVYRAMASTSDAATAIKSNVDQNYSTKPSHSPQAPLTSILTGKPYNYAETIKKVYNHGFLNRYYKEPIILTRGNMQYVYDHNGKEYLDAFGGILAVGVGHCHPKVVEQQMKAITSITHLSCNYVSAEMYEYLDELLATFPEGYSAYLVNSGSEANDLAITMAREYTGNFDVFSFRGAYHGMTSLTMGALGHQTHKYKAPHSFGFHKVLNPNVYRSHVSPENAVEFYAKDLEDAIVCNTHGQLALFMHESIQGVNGYTIYPDGYLKAAHEVVKKYGGLTLADEVQTGWGRTGTSFWHWQAHGIQPDMCVMAKSMGNGVPIGAVVCKTEIMNALAKKVFINTFGGNQFTVATAYAVLKTIQEEKMQENAYKLGSYMKEKFTNMMDKYEYLGDVRGSGFLLGLEFVKNRDTKEPAKEWTANFLENMKSKGILVGRSGYGNCIRVTPPMCFTKENCDRVLEAFEDCIQNTTA